LGRVANEMLKEIVLATADLTLEVKGTQREHEGLLVRTALTDPEHASITAGLLEGKEYAAIAKANKGKNIGAAHCRIGVKFMEAFGQAEIAALEEEAPLKVEFKAWWQKMTGWSARQHLEEIPIFKVTKPRVSTDLDGFDNGYAKVQFCLGQSGKTLENLLVDKFEALGWLVKVGAPPQSTKERKLKSLVKKIMDKE
jgi:hypothetical protein